MNPFSRGPWIALVLCAMFVLSRAALAEPVPDVKVPEGERLLRVLSLQDYNTRMVLFGTTLLGVSGGIIGSFMLLRKQSLVADVVGHSALPGIAMAFILSEMLQPGSGKNVPALLLGALLAGGAGALSVIAIDRYSKIKSDAALAIVLSVFYGLGTALLTVTQRIPTGSAAGLKDYPNGKTASLVAADVWLFAISASVLLAITISLFKELTLVCFDPDFAKARGWPVFLFDTLLVGLVVGVTIIGMQSVGLVLVVAILVTPATSARFWTDGIRSMTLVSGAIGGGSACVGTLLSAAYPKVAAGAVIVLAGGVAFLVSLFFGFKRGVLWNWLQHRRMQQRIGRHDLLRGIYEIVESTQHTAPDEQSLLEARVSVSELLRLRTWSRRRLAHLIHEAELQGFVRTRPGEACQLTSEGAALARRATRNHRLWEMYLITYADIAPSRVDRAADRIEHVLEPEVVRELETRLAQSFPEAMPHSPHQ